MEARKILIAESDNDTMFLMSKLLSKKGYAIDQVSNGPELFNRSFETPDLFIVDHELQVIDGVAICKYLKTNRILKDIPVIIISADNGCEHRAVKAGVNHFVLKPINPADLMRIVNEALCLNKAA